MKTAMTRRKRASVIQAVHDMAVVGMLLVQQHYGPDLAGLEGCHARDRGMGEEGLRHRARRAWWKSV